jgi:transcriptional regulator with XRE-family HTH domain
MSFGQRVRELRGDRGLTQRSLAQHLDVSMSYVCKVENGKLQSGDFPSEKFIHKLAEALDADEDELLLLADKVPIKIRRGIRQQPNLFRKLGQLDSKRLSELELLVDQMM